MAPLGPFDAARRVMAAVSGGADSMALAFLLRGWGRPLAAVVDHGLRPESAEEAALTVRRLSALGIEARIWRAAIEPGPALAVRAREARYALLLEACREAGCADLLLAHHAGDQAETVLLRAGSGSAEAGLAGMAALAYRSEARLLRPLLGTEPARLRATLAGAGLGHVEDPSNRDERTGRGRLRAILTAAERAEALATAEVCGIARAAGERSRAADLALVALRPEGFALVPDHLPAEALASVIWTVSGDPYPPRRASVAGRAEARTLHGVVLAPSVRLRGTLVAREPASVSGPVEAGAGALWDGRFRLLGEARPGARIAALGDAARQFRRRSGLPAIVLRTLPALWVNGELAAVPALGVGGSRNAFRFEPRIPLLGVPFVNLPSGKGAVD